MHVTIKTLQQEKFQVEVDTSETVKALKEKIETEKGKDNFPVEGLKLIYAGKILDDAKTLGEYNMEESKFIVAMVTKPKSAPPSTDTKASTSTTAAAATPAAETPASVTSTAAQPTTPQTTTTAGSTPTVTTTEASPTVTASESALVTGEQFESLIESITAMGFPRDRVETALRASFNNPDRAVEYLMNGLPEDLIPPAAAPRAPTEAPAQEAPATPAVPPGEGGDEANVFDTIRNNRALLMMARTVREDPTLLVSYMQQIGQQNPELLEYIRQHQTEFISFINSLPADERQFVQVTAQEQRDIEQLKALGFSETDCLQAYMAFDKDVEQAANFLFGNMEPWEGTM